MGSSPENLPGGALIGLARAFLGSGDAAHQPQQPTAFGVKQVEYEKDPIPTLKDIAPVARNNFGMPMGKVKPLIVFYSSRNLHKTKLIFKNALFFLYSYSYLP